MEEKRLFFGMEAIAPWPRKFPEGRILNESCRHMTMAFLGKVDYDVLKEELKTIPLPTMKVGFVGKFDQPLFLPPRHPRVVAWHIDLFEEKDNLVSYYKTLKEWLVLKKFMQPDERDFLAHVTVCRAPFRQHEWEKSFTPLPVIVKDLHLYESLGQLNYQPLWSHPLKAPFEEIEHTADIAFHVRGRDVTQLYHHAQAALCFKHPPLLPFLKTSESVQDLNELLEQINRIVSKADGAIGVPFKAVSFHGDLEQEPDQTLKWEMIVDV